MITFIIPGKPFGKQRPRATSRGGHARVYTPKETVSYERMVGQIARQNFPDGVVRVPAIVNIMAEFAMPKSWSKKKREAMIDRPHTQRPDADNIGKAVLDGMNGSVFADDAQVYSLTVAKYWSNVDLVKVMVHCRDYADFGNEGE
jgi:Holliday junction resolvase RusA-like endonuclease